MNVFSCPKSPNRVSYGLLKARLGFALYFAYLSILIIRIISQFNKIGEKPGISLVNTSLVLLISLMSISVSTISLHFLLKDKKYKEDTRKIRIASYSIALISGLTITIIQIISLASFSSTLSKTINDINLHTILGFTGTLLSLFIFYPINIYCRYCDYNTEKDQKERKKHKAVGIILCAMLVLELFFIAVKIIGLMEKKGFFIIEDKMFNLCDNIAYYFNFNTVVGIVCSLIMQGLTTYRIYTENCSSELNDLSLHPGLDLGNSLG